MICVAQNGRSVSIDTYLPTSVTRQTLDMTARIKYTKVKMEPLTTVEIGLSLVLSYQVTNFNRDYLIDNYEDWWSK